MSRRSTALWLFVGYGIFVVYGSLVPLQYKPLDFDQAWQRFQHIPFLQLGLDSRADWVANGVLYAPLAFFAARAAFGFGLAQALAVALAAGLCSALAVGVEFTQLWFPQRTVSLNDILAECIGSAVGAGVAPFLAGWLDRLAHAWDRGGGRLGRHLLELYAAAYLLLCYFPYDLLLSADEIHGKWQGAGWGWWLAAHERGPFFVMLQLAVEVALAAPIGALLLRPAAAGRRPWALAAATGLLLGLLIEVGQFFVDSGVSQGASVLSRSLGVVAGMALTPWLLDTGLAGLRARLRPWAWALWMLYLPVLAAVNGAFSGGRHGLAGAVVSWQQTRLLPFYYHYFTTEAIAMFSLGSVAVMYLPVALLGWARAWSTATILGSAGLLALAIEGGKLFIDGRHPDPTNVLVAVAGNALALGLVAMAQRRSASLSAPAPASASAAASAAAVGPAPSAFGGRKRGSAWLLVLPPVALWALMFPAFPVALLALLLVCAALVWRWPVAALALLPAALPVLDLAPWSGRFYLDEFDLLCAACLAVAFHRTPAPAGRRRWRPLTLAFAILGLSLALSTLRGMWPLAWPDVNSFAGYYSPWNALRIVKGAVWAWLFVALWQRLRAQGERRPRFFAAGMAAGLTMTVLVVCWERLVFASLWDFAADFRVTGMFSTMHKGGAYIECYLALASAFVIAAALRTRAPALRAGALLLLAAAAYAMMVTYSRNGYAALAVVLGVSVAAWLPELRRSGAPWPRQAAYGALLVAVLMGVALPIVGGSYARERLATSAADLAVRQAHWADGLNLRDGSLLTAAIGMGIGRFPETHFWRSTEPVHAASYRLARDGDRPYLRLAQGATLYIDQIIPRPDLGALRLSVDLRADAAPASLQVALCEKWTLTSQACVSAKASVAPATAPASASVSASTAAPSGSGWQTAEVRIDASQLLAASSPWKAPLKLGLMTPATGSVDVSRVRLSTALGDDLLVNGDFTQGMDHWFFATDIDPPWHLHSLPVAVLFDQGWLGVLAWAAVALAALAAGLPLLLRGQALVPAALAALAGFAVSGALNTLVDAPRFLWLLLVLLWLAAAQRHNDPPKGRDFAASAAP